MKVVLVYRKRKEGAYSIEELFHAIAGELSREIDVIEYEAGERRQILRDWYRLRRLRPDVYHVTGDVNYLTYLLPRRKTILTVHDIGHYLFGLTGLKRWLYKWFWMLIPIRKVRVITAVSKVTRDDLVKHLGVSSEKIVVIENCYSNLFRFSRRHFSGDAPIILQVGTKPYKNVPRLVRALQGLQCTLLLVGHIDDEIRTALTESEVPFRNYVNLSHSELYELYVTCDLVSFVSLGEGFGVPILEAQAVGRPLITANVLPLSEVAGDGACLVDPLDISDIRRGIVRLISDAGYRDLLIERGLRNAARYSPSVVAARYLDLYRQTISHG